MYICIYIYSHYIIYLMIVKSYIFSTHHINPLYNPITIAFNDNFVFNPVQPQGRGVLRSSRCRPVAGLRARCGGAELPHARDVRGPCGPCGTGRGEGSLVYHWYLRWFMVTYLNQRQWWYSYGIYDETAFTKVIPGDLPLSAVIYGDTMWYSCGLYANQRIDQDGYEVLELMKWWSWNLWCTRYLSGVATTWPTPVCLEILVVLLEHIWGPFQRVGANHCCANK